MLELEELIAAELADLEHNCWGIEPSNFEAKIATRRQLFEAVEAEIVELCQSLGIRDRTSILVNLWRLWLPLAIQLSEARQQLGRTLIQGVLGGQGTGKSTLAIILRRLLSYLNFSVANLSIDDLYLTYTERQQLQQADPRLIWRGPPGTHDVQLGLKVLEDCLKNNHTEPILIPRFDKSLFAGAGDRITPEPVEKVDLLLFEGWFLGVQPIADSQFESPPVPIITSQDLQFAKDNNLRLQEYLPLWAKLDRLIVLYPTDYRLSKQWRIEAEHKMIAQGKTGMSDAEIDRFVEYFWKSLHPELFITPLIDNPQLTDLVIEINRDRSLGKVYNPACQ